LQGDSVTLTVDSASIYQWNNGANTQSITVSTSGNYSVTVTDVNGCSASSSAITVTVNSGPPIPTITQAGSTLMCSVSGMSTYEWFFNGNTFAGCNSQFCTISQSGFYTVIITDNNGCSASSQTYSIIITGIVQQSAGSNISIYPNPNKGSFTFTFTALQSNEAEIKVLDVLGKTVYYKKAGITQEHELKEIDLGKITTGIYIVQVKVGEKIINRKIIIE